MIKNQFNLEISVYGINNAYLQNGKFEFKISNIVKFISIIEDSQGNQLEGISREFSSDETLFWISSAS